MLTLLRFVPVITRSSKQADCIHSVTLWCFCMKCCCLHAAARALQSSRSEIWVMAAAMLVRLESSTGLCPYTPGACSIYGQCSSPFIISVRSVLSSFCVSVLHLKRQIVFKSELWGKRLLAATTTNPQEDNSSFNCVLLWFTLESPGISGKGHNQIKNPGLKRLNTIDLSFYYKSKKQ